MASGVAAVVVTHAAVEDLDALISSHGLPDDTRLRLRQRLSLLTRFPLTGQALHARWEGVRYIIGPWPWMIVLYEYVVDQNRVSVLAIQDGRSSTAARP